MGGSFFEEHVEDSQGGMERCCLGNSLTLHPSLLRLVPI